MKYRYLSQQERSDGSTDSLGCYREVQALLREEEIYKLLLDVSAGEANAINAQQQMWSYGNIVAVETTVTSEQL